MSIKKIKTEIIQSIFSDHNGMELKIKTRTKTGKFTHGEIKQHTQIMMDQKRNHKENKKILTDQLKRKYNIPKFMGQSESSVKGEMYSYIKKSDLKSRPNFTSFLI